MCTTCGCGNTEDMGIPAPDDVEPRLVTLERDLLEKNAGFAEANRRLFALSGIIGAYLAELASRRGEVTADVVTAQPLSDSQSKALEAELKKVVGGKVAIAARVDPSMAPNGPSLKNT